MKKGKSIKAPWNEPGISNNERKRRYKAYLRQSRKEQELELVKKQEEYETMAPPNVVLRFFAGWINNIRLAGILVSWVTAAIFPWYLMDDTFSLTPLILFMMLFVLVWFLLLFYFVRPFYRKHQRYYALRKEIERSSMFRKKK